MLLQVLGCGTSTGVPIPGCDCPVCRSNNPKDRRTRSSAVVRMDDGTNILIDASPDLRFQCLTWNVRRLEAVLFTHAHADHTLGIEDLRAFNFVQHRSIPCYGSATTLEEIRRFFNYIFSPDPNYEGGALAQLELHEIEPLETLAVGGAPILGFPLRHGRLPVMGYRIGSVAYATDCNGIPDSSIEALRGVDTIIIDGLRYEPHRTHFTIPEAIEAGKAVGANRIILTHTTHSIGYEEVSAKLPAGVELAYDGMEIPIRL